MTAAETLGRYQYTGDVITLIIAVVILIMIKQSLFFTTERNFKLFKRALWLIIIATGLNMLGAYICLNFPNNVQGIYAARRLNHISLMATFHLFIYYVRNQLELKDTRKAFVTITTRIVVTLAIILDFFAPLTHFGFYYDGEKWHDDTYIQPFTLTYIYVIIILGIMIGFWGEKLIKQIRTSLVMVELICVVILVAQNLFHSNGYTSFTFILPMLTVLMMLHSKPYDALTGAMDLKAFEAYMDYCFEKKITRAYVALDLGNNSNIHVPEEIGRAIHSEWYHQFKDTELFNLRQGLFLLTIPVGKEANDPKRIREVIDAKFSRYYEKFKMPFKLLIVEDGDFIYTTEDVFATIDIIMARMKINETHYLTDDEKSELIQGRYITKQIKDIAEKCNLNDERVLVYCQPIINLQTGAFETGEALMRMKLPEIGMVFPDRFIPIAESTGAIHSLSKIILNKTCVLIRRYMDEGYHIERVSVNFSVSELRNENFCKEIVDIISINNVPFEKVAIELTESQNDNDYEMVKSKISELKKYGISFYLDDYGTGYSNFDRVLSLGMDLVKFDRALLLAADENDSVASTMKLFSESFRLMDYKILFEGVETGEHESLCKDCKADYLQGFKYSRPIPMEQIGSFLSREP